MKQVLITSTLHSQNWSLNIQDFLSGNQKKAFKENFICAQNCVAPLFDQFLLCGQKDSSVIHMFSLKKQLHTRWKAPDKITALATTPDSCFIIVAMSGKIHVYQTSSGKLCGVVQRHYQPITCLRVSKCGSFFISGGDDAMVLVWMLFPIISVKESLSGAESLALEPKHTWNNHTAKITDIHCGPNGIHDKCYTASLDSTCKIYDIYSGELLASLTFDEPLWSVVTDAAQNFLFVGGEKGSIFETKLFDQSQILNDLSKPAPLALEGHVSKVTNLCVSFDGLALVSGSHEGKVIVWHIRSKQPMKTYEYKGAITNLLLLITPHGLNDTDHLSSCIVKPFESFEDHHLDLMERGINHVSKASLQIEDIPSIFSDEKSQYVDSELVGKYQEASKKLQELTQINRQLYDYAVDKLFKESLPSME
ncbi:WD repeat-containing protein 18 [Brevipalpus obovatus]|uniref:WD repeat-containing protein 18 n=1 Tax=Brevipalpus obovatus TaxID=246614 RepID=UPI003D9E6A74